MSYNSEPTAESVRDFAKRMQADFSGQDALDQAVQELEAMTQFIAAAKAKGQDSTPGKALRSGLWNQLVRRDAATITISPFIRFNPPDPTDDDDKKHASLLEAWTNSGLVLSGLTPVVEELLARSLIGYGRNWTNLCHDPRIWADDAMKEAVERYAKNPEDEGLKKEIDAYKRDRWPMRLRYVEPVGTYGYGFNAPRHLPEVVECRKMAAEAVENEYGAKAIPKGIKKDTTELDVYVYANHTWEYTAIGKENPVEGHKFKHDLGKSPYTLEESNLIPVSTKGMRWYPALFHAKGLMESFDRLLSDWETNTHENALGHIMQMYDYDKRGDIEGTGRPTEQVMAPGGTTSWWLGEGAQLGPVPTLTQEHREHLRFVYGLIEQNAIQPVLQGETKSGDSQTLIASTVGLAERKFSPAVSARKSGQVDRAQTLLRCVGALNKNFNNFPDKVWIHDMFNGKGAIGIGPKDIIGWMNTPQARGEPAIPLDDHRKWSVNTIKLNSGVPKSQVFEEAGYEDPDAVIRQGHKEMLRDAMVQQVGIPTVIARATGALQSATPGEQQQLAAMQGTGSPPLEQMMAMLQGGGMPPQVNGNIMQGASNVARTGVPQTPQVPQ